MPALEAEPEPEGAEDEEPGESGPEEDGEAPVRTPRRPASRKARGRRS
jgi:hypothetical protein